MLRRTIQPIRIALNMTTTELGETPIPIPASRAHGPRATDHDHQRKCAAPIVGGVFSFEHTDIFCPSYAGARYVTLGRTTGR